MRHRVIDLNKMQFLRKLVCKPLQKRFEAKTVQVRELQQHRLTAQRFHEPIEPAIEELPLDSPLGLDAVTCELAMLYGEQADSTFITAPVAHLWVTLTPSGGERGED